MVRDKNKIYAEKNDEDTVLSEQLLDADALVVGKTDKSIQVVQDLQVNRIITVGDVVQQVGSYDMINKVLKIDENMNFIFV